MRNFWRYFLHFRQAVVLSFQAVVLSFSVGRILQLVKYKNCHLGKTEARRSTSPVPDLQSSAVGIFQLNGLQWLLTSHCVISRPSTSKTILDWSVFFSVLAFQLTRMLTKPSAKYNFSISFHASWYYFISPYCHSYPPKYIKKLVTLSRR